MKRDCVDIEETIWECARRGREIPKHVPAHAAECDSCAQALRDAEAGLLDLASARQCPPAPDCKAAVAARVAPRSTRRLRLRWAWALGAAALIAAACVTPMLRHEPPTEIKQAMTEPVRPPGRQIVEKAPAPAPPRERQVDRQAPPVRERPPVVRSAPSSRPAPRNPVPRPRPATIRRSLPRIPAPPPEPRTFAEGAKDDARPIAVVLVTWDQHPRPDNSYQYSRTDPDTGVTTTCKVTETNGVVEVDMQTSPRPENGGTSNETNPGV